MNTNNDNEAPASAAPFLEIGWQYDNGAEAFALPTLDFRLTPEPPADEGATARYDRKERAYVITGPGISLDEQLALARAMGERAARWVTRPGVGLIRVYSGDHDDDPETGMAGIYPHDFLLLSEFLAGLSGMLGWPATLKVLHPDTLGYMIFGTLEHLGRRARHDIHTAETDAFVGAYDRVSELTTVAANRFVELDAAGHVIGSAKEHSALKAQALKVLAG